MPSKTIWTEGQPSEPVTPENPLVGLEMRVLRSWLENSPSNRRQYLRGPAYRRDLENAVRQRVDQTFAEELQLRAQGKTQAEAEEFTRPSMWTPPTWPTTPTSPPPKPAAKRPAIS